MQGARDEYSAKSNSYRNTGHNQGKMGSYCIPNPVSECERSIARWAVDPSERLKQSYKIRTEAARIQRNEAPAEHPNNGDENRYPERWGNFHKTLPHDPHDGSVSKEAYDKFLKALETGKVSDFEAIPSGGPSKLLNPLGAGVYNIYGPDSAAVPVKPPPSISSKEFGSAMTEMYWMALTRDIPFAQYESLANDPNSLISMAIADLNDYGSAYPGPKINGKVTAKTLFKLDLPGSLDGPIVSQFLYMPVTNDGITYEAALNKPASEDFVTNWDDFIKIQNGQTPLGTGVPVVPGVKEYPCNVRHLGYIAGSDYIYSVPNRAAMCLRSAPTNPNNPYNEHQRMGAFSTFGIAHLLHLMGEVHMGERQAWYVKWLVHRYLRPEAAGGLVHAKFFDDVPRNASIPLDEQIKNTRALKLLKQKYNSYLLPLMFKNGGPTHPSFTAGHAISIGSCVTLLKAWYNTDRKWKEVFGQPKYSPDGKTLVDYTGPDADNLTIGGELNKLAHNLSIGRDMSGVHWRADDIQGLLQGEEVAIRILREEQLGYVENFKGFRLEKFDGTVITI